MNQDLFTCHKCGESFTDDIARFSAEYPPVCGCCDERSLRAAAIVGGIVILALVCGMIAAVYALWESFK